MILTWGISLAVSTRVARMFGKTSIWWPLSASLIATAIALHICRQEEFIDSRWTWSEHAWNVWRLWALVLVETALASLAVLGIIRIAPHVAPRLHQAVKSASKFRRIWWLCAGAVSAIAAMLVSFQIAGWNQWRPHRSNRLRWNAAALEYVLPSLCFGPDQDSFLTVEQTGRVILWDWQLARPKREFRADFRRDAERPRLYAAMLSENRLALASSNNESILVYQLPEWQLEHKIPHNQARTNPIRGLYAYSGGQNLLTVDDSLHNGMILFAFWNGQKEDWVEHTTYPAHSGGCDVRGVSSSGRFAGVVEVYGEPGGDLDQHALSVIDFELNEVVLEKKCGRMSGPVVFFDFERMVAFGNRVFSLDGRLAREFPGIVLAALPGENRLVLVEFSRLPELICKTTENVPILRHIGYLGRVRLAIVHCDTGYIERKSPWYFGYGTRLVAKLSPDAKRIVWCDTQGRLLLWDVPQQ
ncbi:MAG TPA: hypothetical protein VFB96_12990 [Pirellulaceae bacterium]|nr:hypothetical protein [Pirellulaceae bacterium]